MNVETLKIGVVGAGIGGLAAAIALRKKGAKVVVLEQAQEVAEVGAGLQISANGLNVLKALGVLGDGPDRGQRSYGTILRDYKSGRFISRIGEPAAGPTYYYHRADLIDLLLKSAGEVGVEVRLGNKVQEIHERHCPGTVGKWGCLVSRCRGCRRWRAQFDPSHPER